MKISCTTLAFPGWSLEKILQQLADNGYDGVDFRGLGDELQVWKLAEFSTDADATAERIAQAGLVVSAFSGSARAFVTDPADAEKNLNEVVEYARLCRRFGTKFIRIYGGKLGGTPLAEAMPVCVEALRRMSDAAGEGVTLALETHDDWTDSAQLAQLVEQTDRPNVRVLWDLHHPFRMNGESPEATYANIGSLTAATHVKDSRPTAEGEYEYCLAGEGDVPLAEMIGMLIGGGYDGYITLEWEKKWHPELPDAEVVLPSYAKYLRKLAQ